MLVLTGGKERATEEYRGLLAKRGFQLNKVVPTEAEFVIIEAIPACVTSSRRRGVIVLWLATIPFEASGQTARKSPQVALPASSSQTSFSGYLATL